MEESTRSMDLNPEQMTPYQAAELMESTETDYDWRAPDETKYISRRWCNAAGEKVIGFGATVLEAAIDSERKCRMENTKRGY